MPGSPEERALPLRGVPEEVSGRCAAAAPRCGTVRPAGRAATRCNRRVLRRHVRPDVSLHPRARREPRSRWSESRASRRGISRLVDVNDPAVARHARSVWRTGPMSGSSGPAAGSAAGSRRWRSPSAVAWALAQGTGVACPVEPARPIAEVTGRAISERRRSTPSGVSRCSRNPVDRGFALPGRSGPPHEISRPSAYTQARVLPSFPFAAQVEPSTRSRAHRSPECSASLLSEAGR